MSLRACIDLQTRKFCFKIKGFMITWASKKTLFISQGSLWKPPILLKPFYFGIHFSAIFSWVTKLTVANFEGLSKGWCYESEIFFCTNHFYKVGCVLLCFVNHMMWASIKRKPTLKISLGVMLKTTTRGHYSLFQNKTSGPIEVVFDKVSPTICKLACVHYLGKAVLHVCISWREGFSHLRMGKLWSHQLHVLI